MKAWSHLPNAKHIDRILAHLKENDPWNAARPHIAWNTTRQAARNAAREAAYSAAYNAEKNTAWNSARQATWDSARQATWDSARETAWNASRDAILALVAYDDCAYLLDQEPEHVQMLALLGNHQAILLYPACVAMQKEVA